MAPWIVAMALLQQMPPETVRTPPEADVPAVLAYCKSLPPDVPLLMRFLSFYNIPHEDRADAVAVTTHVLNELSWAVPFCHPVIVPETNGRVIAFNAAELARTKTDLKTWLTAWEQLTAVDYVYLEPWVDSKMATELAALTDSAGPILRADFFCYWARQDDNPATKAVTEGFYSKFLGLPDDEVALFQLLRVSQAGAKINGSDRRAGVVVSGKGSDAHPVARNNRFLNRLPSDLRPHGGYLWFTQDFINSQDTRDIRDKRNLLTDAKDGGEYIWSLPNGLHGYYLTQAKQENGKTVFKRINQVPDNVAVANIFPHGRVRMDTCFGCHPSGINTFGDVIYPELLRPGPPGGVVALYGSDFEKTNRAKQLFYPDLASYVRADRENYALAVETMLQPMKGWQYTPEDAKANKPRPVTRLSGLYKRFIDKYEAPINAAGAQWEYGTDQPMEGEDGFLADKVVSTTDGSLLSLLKGGDILRDTFEKLFQNGKLIQNVKANIVRKGGVNQTDFVVPATVAGTAHGISIPVDTNWLVVVGSKSYKADDTLLGKWLLEGRILADSKVSPDQAKPDWKRADVMFPEAFQKTKEQPQSQQHRLEPSKN